MTGLLCLSFFIGCAGEKGEEVFRYQNPICDDIDHAGVWSVELDLASLEKGDYHVALRIPNPMSGGMPIRFAKEVQDLHADGWLTLASIILEMDIMSVASAAYVC